MNNLLMETWTTIILKPFLNKNKISHFRLLIDSAPAHIKVLNDIQNILNNLLLTIPEEATYLMQSVDLSIGKPFKDNLRIHFIKWFDNNHKNYTAKKNSISPKPNDIIELVDKTMKTFNEDIIKNSFKLSGYTISILNKEKIQLFNKKLLDKDKIRKVIDESFLIK